MLETAEEVTCQDTESKHMSEGYPPAGDGRGRDLSGHEKNTTERGGLTSCGQPREGFVRTRKASDQAWGTHYLETEREGLVRTRKESD